MGQVGSGPGIPVAQGRCLVIAGTSIYVQQNGGSWALSTAILGGDFASFADPTTSQSEANAEAYVASCWPIRCRSPRGFPRGEPRCTYTAGGKRHAWSFNRFNDAHHDYRIRCDLPCYAVRNGGRREIVHGQTLTVHTGAGVSCATAVRVLTDLFAGKAQNHQGADLLSSYFSVDGWRCTYGDRARKAAPGGS